MWEVGRVVGDAEAARAGAGVVEEDAKDQRQGERKWERQGCCDATGVLSGREQERLAALSWAWRAETLEDVMLTWHLSRPANSEGGQDGRTMLDDTLRVALGRLCSLWCTNGWAMVGVRKKEVGRRIVALTTPT
ncbi:hypothetical protein B0H11DRAFT_2194457 [Mycena galericulata]|nr:hypothetical protein B0H11DRAFT_2194457 [Mycena galericulata]